MLRNEDVRFTSSPSLKLPNAFKPQTLLTRLLSKLKSPPPFAFSPALLCSASLSLTHHSTTLKPSPLLCSSTLALTDPVPSQPEPDTAAPHKGRLRQQDEERVLISEVLVRNKDGEELERKDLEGEALGALKASRANSALTVREVQEDVGLCSFSQMQNTLSAREFPLFARSRVLDTHLK